MSKASKTDWKSLETLQDGQIDTSEIPELSDEFFVRAELHVRPGSPSFDTACAQSYCRISASTSIFNNASDSCQPR